MSLRTISSTDLAGPARRPTAPTLTVAGRYDRRAIMRQAVAKARQLGWGMSWSRRMAVALKTVWAWAKKEMAAPIAAFPPCGTAKTWQPHQAAQTFCAFSTETPRRRVRTFDRGSRIFSHGW